MKKLIMVLISVAVVATTSGCGYHMMKKKQAMMTEGFGTQMESRLDLTEEQVQKLDELTEGKMAATHQHMMDMMKSLMALEPEDADYADKVDELVTESTAQFETDVRDFAETRAKIHAELTEEQIAELRELRAEMGRKFQRWHKKHDNSDD